MSDSELSSPPEISSAAEIEQVLRRVVREALAQDVEITVNLARARAESQLGLETGYLKNTGNWKQQSKEIINAAVEDPTSPARPSRAVPKPKSKRGNDKSKRDSGDALLTRKRQKKAGRVESEEEDGESLSESEDKSSVRVAKRQAASEQDRVGARSQEQGLVPQTAENSDLSNPPSDQERSPPETVERKLDEGDDSDLSSVIDDPPPRKRQRKPASSETKPKAKPKATPKQTTIKSKAGGKDLSADDEEVKRLQGWLLKCGIRKMWHKELAPYETSKDKIRHLKSSLANVGMTGRYSVEKARQIKERRELAAELQSAQEYNEKWGRDGSEEAEEGKEAVRPRRTAPKGLVDFGDSGDSSG